MYPRQNKCSIYWYRHLIILPVVIGLLIYLVLQVQTLKQVNYKLYSQFIIRCFPYSSVFALKDYPGKDLISIVAVSSALLYIIFVALSKTKKV